jgi:hypothetical protein
MHEDSLILNPLGIPSSQIGREPLLGRVYQAVSVQRHRWRRRAMFQYVTKCRRSCHAIHFHTMPLSDAEMLCIEATTVAAIATIADGNVG